MYRKRLLYLICFITIYFLCLFFHNKITNDNLKEVYVLTKDITRGESLTKNNTKKIKVEDKAININYVDNVDNLLSKETLKLGTILSKNDVVQINEYEEINEDKENILIDIGDMTSSLNVSVEKGSIVNIYYTGRSSQLNGVIDKSKYSKVESGSITDSYITLLLLKDIEVKAVYDKSGNNIEEKVNNVSAISIEVDENTAMLIENIKKYGEFSITVKR